MLQTLTAVLSIASLVFYGWLISKYIRIRKTIKISSFSKSESTKGACVVIAARNESDSIGECLKSILSQDSVEKIVLVDDHSDDNTTLVAKANAGHDKRLLVMHAPELAEGWIGKNHALHYGAKEVASEYILFTDADVIITSGTIAWAVNIMKDCNLDHLSGNFFIKCHSVGEHICAPVLAASSALALFCSGKTVGAATGAFNMIRSDFYHKIGGHEKIRNCIVDDVALARLVKSCGGKTDFVDFNGKVSVRLFRGFKGFFEAISRSAQSYLGNNIWLPVSGGMGIICIGLFGFISPLIFIFADNSLKSLGFTSYMLGLGCCLSFKSFHDANPFFSVFYPVGVSLLGMATIYSSLRKILGLQINWRGRKYISA